MDKPVVSMDRSIDDPASDAITRGFVGREIIGIH
jgi:hypothetical protein